MKRGGRPVKKAHKGQTVTIELPLYDKSKKKIQQGLLFRVDVRKRRRHEGKSFGEVKRRDVECPVAEKKKIFHILERIHLSKEVHRPSDRPQSKGSQPSASFFSDRKKMQQVKWWIKLTSLPLAQQRFPVEPDSLIVPLTPSLFDGCIEELKKGNKLYQPFTWALPPIISDKKIPWFSSAIEQLIKLGFTSFQVGHISQVKLFEQASKGQKNLQLFSDYTVSVLNSSCLLFGEDLGLRGMVLSPEIEE